MFPVINEFCTRHYMNTHLRRATIRPPSGLMALGTGVLQVRGLPLAKCSGLTRTYAGNSCAWKREELWFLLILLHIYAYVIHICLNWPVFPDWIASHGTGRWASCAADACPAERISHAQPSHTPEYVPAIRPAVYSSQDRIKRMANHLNQSQWTELLLCS